MLNTLRDRKGAILIISYLIIVVLVILGVTFMSRSSNERRLAERERNFVQTFYLAEAGIDYGLVQLRGGDSSGTGSGSLSDIGDFNCSWQEIGTSNRWEIISTGYVGDITRRVIVEVQPDTFARYLYFTDSEHFRWYGFRTAVWFVTGDYLGGPLQTNDHLHISGDPVFADPNFHKPVKSASDSITYMHGGPPQDNPDFQDGIELGADIYPMPSKALDLRTAAVHDGLKLTGDTTVRLQSNGTMNVTNSHEGWVNQNMCLPANDALFVEGGDLTISGTLNGQLSVGTNRNIIVDDDIHYNTNPRTDPTSTDTLGLIAERDVVVSQSAPYDLNIEASVMALGNSFVIEIGRASSTF